jgi:hypothetical protein
VAGAFAAEPTRLVDGNQLNVEQPAAVRTEATKILQTWMGVPVDTKIQPLVDRQSLGHGLPGLVDAGLDSP